ncbi:hypothetical protein N0V90_003536 [Kalmusia sp. IMI 367209]|nr:hypothetical protein N0V90_003536 [Kalmusia sp. IMI 367209]
MYYDKAFYPPPTTGPTYSTFRFNPNAPPFIRGNISHPPEPIVGSPGPRDGSNAPQFVSQSSGPENLASSSQPASHSLGLGIAQYPPQVSGSFDQRNVTNSPQFAAQSFSEGNMPDTARLVSPPTSGASSGSTVVAAAPWIAPFASRVPTTGPYAAPVFAGFNSPDLVRAQEDTHRSSISTVTPANYMDHSSYSPSAATGSGEIAGSYNPYTAYSAHDPAVGASSGAGGGYDPTGGTYNAFGTSAPGYSPYNAQAGPAMSDGSHNNLATSTPAYFPAYAQTGQDMGTGTYNAFANYPPQYSHNGGATLPVMYGYDSTGLYGPIYPGYHGGEGWVGRGNRGSYRGRFRGRKGRRGRGDYASGPLPKQQGTNADANAGAV